MPKTILVIEDDAEIAELIDMTLKDAGYNVTIRAEPTTALEILKQRRMDCLITDVHFDGTMDGIALIHKARELDPLLKVICATGGDIDPPERVVVLKKPFRMGHLVSVLEALL
jgi:DNA-binding NtrC family response regulator